MFLFSRDLQSLITTLILAHTFLLHFDSISHYCTSFELLSFTRHFSSHLVLLVRLLGEVLYRPARALASERGLLHLEVGQGLVIGPRAPGGHLGGHGLGRAEDAQEVQALWRRNELIDTRMNESMVCTS